MELSERHIQMMIKVINDAHEHIKMETPNRVWSTYFRYALNDLEKGNEYISQSMIESPNQKKIRDHTVPFKIVRDKLLAIENINYDSVSKILNRFHVVTIISIEEDQKLKDAGLNSRMPKNWDGINSFARYETVGIII